MQKGIKNYEYEGCGDICGLKETWERTLLSENWLPNKLQNEPNLIQISQFWKKCVQVAGNLTKSIFRQWFPS